MWCDGDRFRVSLSSFSFQNLNFLKTTPPAACWAASTWLTVCLRSSSDNRSVFIRLKKKRKTKNSIVMLSCHAWPNIFDFLDWNATVWFFGQIFEDLGFSGFSLSESEHKACHPHTTSWSFINGENVIRGLILIAGLCVFLWYLQVLLGYTS